MVKQIMRGQTECGKEKVAENSTAPFGFLQRVCWVVSFGRRATRVLAERWANGSSSVVLGPPGYSNVSKLNMYCFPVDLFFILRGPPS